MILSVFISLATLASVLDYNSFELNKNWYQQYQVQYFDTKIDNTQGDTDQANMDESGHELTYSLAKKISRNTFAYIDINYQERNETSLRYGLTTKNIYRRKGFQEPSIGFLSRRQFSKKTGQANIDFVFKYTPSIGNRVVGPNNESNNWSGRQVFQFGLTHQWDYPKWFYSLNAHYYFFGQGSEEDRFENATRVFEAYGDFIARFEARHLLTDKLWIKLGTGIRFIEDQVFKFQSERSEINLGTGSYKIIGLMYQSSKKCAIQLDLERFKNDYFIKSQMNFAGSYEQQNITLNYISFY